MALLRPASGSQDGPSTSSGFRGPSQPQVSSSISRRMGQRGGLMSASSGYQVDDSADDLQYEAMFN
jgi:hypothetical protein